MTTPMGALALELRDAPRVIVSAAGRADRSFVVGAVKVGADGDRAGAASGTSRVPDIGDSVGDSAVGNCAVLMLGCSDACARRSGGSTGSEMAAGGATGGDGCVGAALVSASPSLDCLVLAAGVSSRR